MVDQLDVRDVEDIDRPSEIFPAMTTPTEPKHHSQPHRGVDVLPSSSFRTGRFWLAWSQPSSSLAQRA